MRLTSRSLSSICTLISFFSLYLRTSSATEYITYTTEDGDKQWLDVNRQPALFTQDFGDCQGDSVIKLERFDAAYYKDNMTISVHFGGYSTISNESTMLQMSVYAYGENRFQMTFDPCFANVRSMCPINTSVPITADIMIPVAPSDVSGIPPIALSIPDFEGQAILRVFGNTTQSQIACYSAVLGNGNSMSQPVAVGSVVGVFVAVAFVASVATAIYGSTLQETRKHYAHSLSIFVVFSVLQHVFFTGALSVNFPSILVAFWSNFGWASGMIYTKSMQKAINDFVGKDRGNIRMLGSAPSGQNINLGGGYSLASIYKRSFDTFPLVNKTTGFDWYGELVEPGLPLPGNFSSFAGTLGQLSIPASNAFLTGLLWFLIINVVVVGCIVLLKLTLELLAIRKASRFENLAFFRRHWIYCAAVAVMRSAYIAFFAMIFLSLFQFTIGGGAGPIAIAALVFCLFILAMLGLSGYAVHYRLGGQSFHNEPSKLQRRAVKVGKKTHSGWTTAHDAEKIADPRTVVASIPWRNMYFTDPMERPHPHDDDNYLIKFGWLSARFRRSRWWFFSAWLIYELGRACFYGAAAGKPLIQVFGLLIWEILALCIIVTMKPFESNRLNMLMVYLLGFSKVVSVALCSAFDPRFGLGRILCVVIGVIIIVIQGVLVICTLIAIIVGAISSWMSIRRNREVFHPSRLAEKRTRFLEHVDDRAQDQKVLIIPAAPPEPVSSVPKEPYFAVTTIRRESKIGDDEPEVEYEHEIEEDSPRVSMDAAVQLQETRPSSQAQSMKSRSSVSNLPYGARRHRASWSNVGLPQGYEADPIPSGVQSRMSMESIGDYSRDMTSSPNRRRASSMRGTWSENPSLVDVANSPLPYPPNAYKSKHRRSKTLSQTQLQNRYITEEIEDRPTTRGQQ